MTDQSSAEYSEAIARHEEMLGEIIKLLRGIDAVNAASRYSSLPSFNTGIGYRSLGPNPAEDALRFSSALLRSAIGPDSPDELARRVLSYDNRISAIQAENADLRAAVSNVDGRLKHLELAHSRYAGTLQSALISLSRSKTLAKVRFHRVIPIHIYLGEADRDQGEVLYRSVIYLLEQNGFEPLAEAPAKISSWIKDALAQSKKVLTSREVQTRLAKVEQSLELKNIDLVRAERDKLHSEAVLNIASALEGQSKGVIRIGSVACIKFQGPSGSELYVRTLTAEQQELVEQHPFLENDPELLFQTICANTPQHTSAAGRPRIPSRRVNLDPPE